MTKIMTVLLVMCAGTVFSADKSKDTFLAFKTTPQPVSQYARGYAAGLAACSCGPSVVFAPSAPTTAVTVTPVVNYFPPAQGPVIDPVAFELRQIRSQQFLQDPPVLK